MAPVFGSRCGSDLDDGNVGESPTQTLGLIVFFAMEEIKLSQHCSCLLPT